MMEVNGGTLLPVDYSTVTIAGVGVFKRDGSKWTYTPDPNLTPDEAAKNLIAAIERLLAHNP